MGTPNESAGLKQRIPEAGVALFLLICGLVVIVDSVRVGIAWADDGPQAGYFPFFIGILLSLSSGWTLLNTVLTWKKNARLFSQWCELRDVAAMLVPTTLFIVTIPFLGLYLPSAVLIGYFMRRHGNFGLIATMLTALGVPLSFFLIFERWFLVPLAKGPIEAWLGF